jgi:hypothetical protein
LDQRYLFDEVACLLETHLEFVVLLFEGLDDTLQTFELEVELIDAEYVEKYLCSYSARCCVLFLYSSPSCACWNFSFSNSELLTDRFSS